MAEPGWTMWMVSHFHYDPVWWNTQGQFTEARLVLPDEDGELPDTRTAFDLVRLHLEKARRDPDYKFVLAELDYLKPHFDAFPQRPRAILRSLLADGRRGARRRHLQRAEHEPDRRGDHDPQRGVRHGVPARTCSGADAGGPRGCSTRSGSTPGSPG